MNNNNGRYRNVTNNNEQWLGNQWRFKFLDSDIKSLADKRAKDLANSAGLGRLSEAPAYKWRPAGIQDASRDQIAP